MTGIDVPLDTPATPLQRLARLAAQHQLGGVLKSTAQVFSIRVLGAGLTYASMMLLARWLGSHNFGIYAYVVVTITLLGLAFSFGFSSSAVRFVASYRAQKKLRRLSGYLSRSFQIVLLISLFGASVAAVAVFAFRDLVEPYYFVPLLVGFLCVPIWTLLNQLEATARGFGWVNMAYVPGYVLRPLALILIVACLIWSGVSVNATIAIWALIGACGVAAFVQAVLIYTGSRPCLADVKPTFHTRHWFAVSLSFFAIDSFRMLLDNTDVLLIGQILDPDSVAVYFAVIRTSGLVAFVSFSVIALAVPKFAEIHSIGTREELQNFVTSLTQLMFWPSLAAAVLLGCFGAFLLSLFGPEFVRGYPTMLVVLTGLVLRTATMPVEYLLNMTGHHRDTIRVYAFAAGANVILNMLLIPTLGILGAAIGSYVAMLAGNVWLYRLVQRRLGVSACVISVLKSRSRNTCLQNPATQALQASADEVID
jgi:O-antigen/teichoic acid export membrane protein